MAILSDVVDDKSALVKVMVTCLMALNTSIFFYFFQLLKLYIIQKIQNLDKISILLWFGTLY